MRCSKKCARPDLPGVSSADPTRYQSMCVTTGARWSGINTTCMPFESWNMRASNSPADANVGAPVLDTNTKRVGASRRQIIWHHGPLVRGLRIIELLLQTPVEACFSYCALPQMDPRRFNERRNHKRAEPNNLQDRSCRMGIFPLTSVSHPVCRYGIGGPCADFGIDGVGENPPDDMSHHNGSGANQRPPKR